MMSPNQKKNAKASVLTPVLVVFFILLSFVGERFGDAGVYSVLLPTAFFAVFAAVIAFSVRQAVKGKQSEDLAGPAAAKHLCESHNGAPVKAHHRDDADRHSARSEYTRKAEGINDLYNAGIISASERAERLAALR